MKFETAVRKATRELLASEKMRTVNGHVIEMELARDEPDMLVVLTWGYDYKRVRVPTTWREMINKKMHAQLGRSELDEVVLRYSFRIMRLCE